MTKDPKTYNILVVEDNSGDLLLIEDLLLEQIAAPQIINAKRFEEAKRILLSENMEFNVILLDLTLPDRSGVDLIAGIRQLSPDIPVIVLTGHADFAFSVNSLSLGVSDYLLKDELSSLVLYKSIVYSSERKRTTVALEISEKQYSDLFQLSPVPIMVCDMETLRFLDVNEAAINNYGYTLQEFLSMTILQIRPEEDIPIIENAWNKDNYNQDIAIQGINRHKRKNGDIIHVDLQVSNIHYKGRDARVAYAHDITERLNALELVALQNASLMDIAWMQSHIIRAPLARVIGMVDLIKDMELHEIKEGHFLEYILLSANELDEVVKSIINKTKI